MVVLWGVEFDELQSVLFFQFVCVGCVCEYYYVCVGGYESGENEDDDGDCGFYFECVKFVVK